MPEDTSVQGNAAASWVPACMVVGMYMAVIVVAAVALPCPEPETHGTRLVLCLLAVEVVALAVAAPFLAAQGAGAVVRLVLVPILGMELGSIVLFATAARGGVLLAAILWCHLFLFAFAWLAAALTMALMAIRLRVAATVPVAAGKRDACRCTPALAQVVATLVGLFMVGQVFFANSAIEGVGERSKMPAIDAVVWTNPWLIVGGSILEADPLRSRGLYDEKWSVVAEYGFRYPGSWIAGMGARTLFLTGVYGAVAGLFQAAAWVLGRRRRGTIPAPLVDT